MSANAKNVCVQLKICIAGKVKILLKSGGDWVAGLEECFGFRGGPESSHKNPAAGGFSFLFPGMQFVICKFLPRKEY